MSTMHAVDSRQTSDSAKVIFPLKETDGGSTDYNNAPGEERVMCGKTDRTHGILNNKFLNKFGMIANLTYAIIVSGFLFSSNWASAADKAFIVTTEEWPPFVSSELVNNGWAMEIAREALELQGYEVSLQLLPWARSVRCAKSGRCDGLYLSYYVEERTEWAAFSDPIGELRTGLFKLKDRDISFETLDDLRPFTIGITRGAAVSEEFDKADYLRKDPVPHDSVNIKKLLRGRVDMVVGAEPVMKYLIRTTLPEEDHDKFDFMSPYLSAQSLHMAVSKNSPDYEQKLQDFNEGLARIKADGTYDAIRREHGY